MNQKDYRIGNYLIDREGRLSQVYQLSSCIEDCKVYAIYGGTTCLPCVPLTLSNDWLESFGFDRSGLYYVKAQVYVYLSANEDCDFEYRFNYTYKPLKYVHELQNLFYFLTGLELGDIVL